MIVLKKDRKKWKVYLSYIQRIQKDGHWTTETIKSFGGFEPEVAEKVAKALKDALPLMNEKLEEQKEKESKPPDEPIHFRNGDEIINLGSIYIVYSLIKLGIRDLMEKIQHEHDCHYSFWQLFCFMIISKIIWPGSLEAEYNRKGVWVDSPPVKQDILYTFLDVLYPHIYEFEEVMYHHGLYLTIDKDKQIDLLFDGTNIFFFIKEPDKDLVKKIGELIFEGLRTYGFSKENRRLPILGIGIIAIQNGTPIAWTVYPGRQREAANLDAMLARILNHFPLRDGMCVIADRGNYSAQLIYNIVHSGLQYIIGKSIKMASDSLKYFALYTPSYVIQLAKRDGKARPLRIKSRIEDQTFTVRINGKSKKIKMPQFQLVYYSPSYAAKEAHAREDNLEDLEELLQSEGKVNSYLHRGKMKYAKIVRKQNPEIDYAKVLEDAKYDGYYAITSSILDESDFEVLRHYKLLSMDERDFRILKTCLALRPVYLRTPEHLIAYVMICMVSLRVLRYLEDFLENKYSCEQIQESMKLMLASIDQDGKYYHLNGDDQLIRTLLEKTEEGFSRMNYTLDELKDLFAMPEVQSNPYISL